MSLSISKSRFSVSKYDLAVVIYPVLSLPTRLGVGKGVGVLVGLGVNVGVGILVGNGVMVGVTVGVGVSVGMGVSVGTGVSSETVVPVVSAAASVGSGAFSSGTFSLDHVMEVQAEAVTKQIASKTKVFKCDFFINNPFLLRLSNEPITSIVAYGRG